MSEEFEVFMKKNCIRQFTSAPYHPAAKGCAERAVQTFKAALKKMKCSSEETIMTLVNRFLFHYRITPATMTGQSPAELLIGCQLKSAISLLKPDWNPNFVVIMKTQLSRVVPKLFALCALVSQCGYRIMVLEQSGCRGLLWNKLDPCLIMPKLIHMVCCRDMLIRFKQGWSQTLYQTVTIWKKCMYHLFSQQKRFNNLIEKWHCQGKIILRQWHC